MPRQSLLQHSLETLQPVFGALHGSHVLSGAQRSVLDWHFTEPGQHMSFVWPHAHSQPLVFSPSQSANPGLHTEYVQRPAEQETSDALATIAVHAFWHPPQLKTSDWMSTQTCSQHSLPPHSLGRVQPSVQVPALLHCCVPVQP